jgi:hypothetical protein
LVDGSFTRNELTRKNSQEHPCLSTGHPQAGAILPPTTPRDARGVTQRVEARTGSRSVISRRPKRPLPSRNGCSVSNCTWSSPIRTRGGRSLWSWMACWNARCRFGSIDWRVDGGPLSRDQQTASRPGFPPCALQGGQPTPPDMAAARQAPSTS